MKFEPGEEKISQMFQALSALADKAYANPRLVSSQVLSKTPHNQPMLRRFILVEPLYLPGKARLLKLVLRCLALNLGHVFLLFLGGIALWASGLKRPDISNSAGSGEKLLVLDTFLVLPKVARSGRYDELYLAGLDKIASGEGWRVLNLFRFYDSRNPLLLYRVFKILKSQGVEALTELHLMRFTDWLRLLAHAIIYPFSLLRFARSINIAGNAHPEAYVKEALLHSLGECGCHGEGRRIAGRRLAEWLRSLTPGRAKIISWHESQPVNKGFYLGLNEARRDAGQDISCIGAQLFIWPNALLNNIADPVDAAHSLAPDKVLVNGPYFVPEGWPGIDAAGLPTAAGAQLPEYAAGPALRYAPLFSQAPEAAADQKSGELLVLLSYHPAEIRRALELAAPLAASGQALAYKFHPATRVDDYRTLLPATPKLVEGNLYAALRDAAAVLGSGSGALAEAAALGVPVLSIMDSSGQAGLDLNYLPPFGRDRLWLPVSRPDDVAPALQTLLAARAGDGFAGLVREFRDLLFSEPHQEFIKHSFEL